MQPFRVLTGLVAPLDRANVDTDVIIPKQFLKSINRSGFGPNLFDSWRYLDRGEPGVDNTKRPLNPDFVLNAPRYQGAQILLARLNFGCGSSREYAVAALAKHGVGGIVAKSFARIFFRNCINLGIPVLESADALAVVHDGDEVTLDLAAGVLRAPAGEARLRSLAPFAQEILAAGGVVAYLREHGDFPPVP